jgi:hypothetical protein
MKLGALLALLLLPTCLISAEYSRHDFYSNLKKKGSSLIPLCDTISSNSQTFGATLDYDAFVGTNGTNLSAHAMNVGSGWTIANGAFTIQSNSAATSAALSSIAVTDCGQSGCISTQITWTPTAAETNAGFNATAYTRFSNGTNYVAVELDGSGTFLIGTFIAGTWTSRASTALGALSAGTRYTIMGVWSGNNLVATVNGGNAISYTTTFNSTATKQGIGGFSDGTNLISLSSFYVNNSSVLENPAGVKVRMPCNFNLVVKVATAPADFPNATLPYLTIWFQSSSDDGQTWNDCACLTTAGYANWYIPISTVAAGGTSISPISDGAIVSTVFQGATVVQGCIGDRMRIRYAISPGSSGIFSFQTFVQPSYCGHR